MIMMINVVESNDDSYALIAETREAPPGLCVTHLCVDRNPWASCYQRNERSGVDIHFEPSKH